MRASSRRSSGEYRPHDAWYDGNEYRIHHTGRKHYAGRKHSREVGAGFRRWEVKVEKISAITLRAASMRTSVQFYRDVLGMEIMYGGEDGYFSSLRTKDAKEPILNLEQGRS